MADGKAVVREILKNKGYTYKSSTPYTVKKEDKKNTTNKTTPQKTTEKQTTDTKKDGFFSWLGKNAMSGIAQFNKGVTATLDLILPTEFLGKYDVISKLNDYYGGANNAYATEAQKSSESRGKGWKAAGDIVSGTVAAAPNAILAFMSSGVSLGANATTSLSTAASSSSSTLSAIGQVVKNMAKKPTYWTSVMQTLGTDYEEAKERGANDLVASATAILTTALNAGIEVGGGIETLPDELLKNKKGLKNAVYKWAKSSFEEGGEEVLQSITTNAIAKLMYDHDAPVWSTTDENAVVNPVKLAKEFGMGVAVGGVLGGVQSSVAGTINAKRISDTGKYFKNAGADAVQAIIDTGLESPKDSTAYKLAEIAQKKSDKLSNYEIGKLYYANVEQIETEETAKKGEVVDDTTATVPTTTVSVGDTFKDTKTGRDITIAMRDAEKTITKVTNGIKTEIKEFSNSQIDFAVNSGQLEKYVNETTEESSTVAENATVDTPSTNKTSATVATEPRNIFTDELDEIAKTEMPSASVGDYFVDKGSHNIIKVIGRNESVTEVEISRPDGIKETKLLPNKMADSLAVDDKYMKVDSFSNSDVFTKVQSDDNNSITQVANVISGEKLTSKQIDKIISTPELKEAFEQLTSLKLVGSKAEQRAIVRDAQNTIHENTASTETTPLVETVTDSLDGADADVDSEFLSPEKAQTYNILVSNLKRKAESLNLDTRNFYDSLADVNMGALTKNDMARINTGFRQLFSGSSDSLVTNWLDGMDNIMNGNPITSIKAKNIPVTNKTEATDEVTSATDKETTEEKIRTVVDSMNETLKEGALEEIYASIPSGYEKSLDTFAEKLISAYNKVGNLGYISEYFTDGGKKVVDAIEGNMKTTQQDESIGEHEALFTDGGKAVYDMLESGEPDGVEKNVRYAISVEENSDASLQTKIKKAIAGLKESDELLSLDTKTFSEEGKKISEQVEAYFDSIGNSVFRKDFGNVELNKKGIKSAIAHGIGRAKCIAFRAVPEVIRNGEQIDYQTSWKGRKYDTVVFAGKVKIGDENAYVGVVVKKQKDSNEYYLHEIVDENGDFIQIKNNEVVPFKTVSETDDGLHGGTTSSIDNISQKEDIVNTYNMQDSEKYSVESEENTKYTISVKKSIFTAEPEVLEKFSKQIDKWLNGSLASNEQLELGQTSEVLKQLGAKGLPVVMSQDVLTKITGEKHTISLDEIKQLPNAIADPIMVFKSATVDNAFVILTELTDKNGNDIIVAMHLNRYQDRMKINRIASVYGKNNIINFVQKQIKQGNLKYIEKNKSQNWSTSRGLQLPKLVQSNPDNNIILQKEDIVNTYNMQDSEKYSVESEENNEREREDILSGNSNNLDNSLQNQPESDTMKINNIKYSLESEKWNAKRNTSRKRTIYNEYQTNALMWARSTGRKAGDTTILNANGKYFALIEATEDDFIELRKGSYKEVQAYYERAYREAIDEVYGNTESIKAEQGRDIWDLQHVGYGKNDDRDGRQIGSEGLQDDSARSDEYLRRSYKGKYDSDRIEVEEKKDKGLSREKTTNSYSVESEDNNEREREDILSGNSNNLDNSLQNQPESDTIESKPSSIHDDGKRYSLSDEYWHTDLTKKQVKQVEKWLRDTGSPETTKITDTANWYKGRIDGKDLFVIYSTEDVDKPTILYEIKGNNARAELDILLDLLEEEENGKSINGKPSFTQRLSEGSWLQDVNSSQSNLRRMGNRGNNQDAGVLQRQSKRNGSRAFRNVIENLFRKQEQGGSIDDSFNYSVESEDNNEQTGNDILSGNSNRGNNESAGEQAGRLRAFKQSIEGKTRAERKSFAKELLAKGQTEEITDGKHQFNVVKEDAYNDDMLSIVEEAKAKGKDVGFFIGNAQRKFDSKRNFLIDGIYEDGGKILLRYDGVFSPQTLLAHENVHDEWDTPEMQAAKDEILNDLTEEEKKKLLSEGRYREYLILYKGDTDAVWEEFVADVFAGMNDYTADYIDVVTDYWYGEESVDRYNPAEYNKITDAGGVENGSEKRNIDRGTGRVLERNRNKGRRNTGNQRDLSNGQTEVEDKAVDNISNGKGSNAERSDEIFMEASTHGSVGEKTSGRKETDGRRFLEAVKNGDETTARTLLDKKASQAGFIPSARYHGTNLDEVFTEFKNDGGANWVSTDLTYAEQYTDGYFGNDEKAEQLFTSKDSGVYDLYVKTGNMLDVGKLEEVIKTPADILEFAKKIGFSKEEIMKCWNSGRGHESNEIWTMTITPEFAEIARSHGYDSLKAIEGDGIETYGILYPENIKSAKTVTFDENGEIIPLEKRFDTSKTDIRYSLATDGKLDLEDLWSGAIENYGTIPKGENPARDVTVPNKISETQFVSRFARTMMEAGVTPDIAISEFEQRILDGTMTHEVISDKSAQNAAESKIKEDGFEEALRDWETYVKDEKAGKNETALGMVLYNQAITNKDVKTAMKIAAELVANATRAGQTLQASRMLKMMSPDGQLYYLEKSVQKMNKEFKEKLGDKYKDIKMSDELMEKFLYAKDEEAKKNAYDALCQNIADQIPSTFRDKWDSWRYLAMLGNTRTHLRNILGNAAFVPAIRIKNFVGAAIEKTAKIKAEDRTKSFAKSKEAVEFAKKDYKVMENVLKGVNAKYAVTGDIEEKRRIFKSKLLEKARTTNFKFLEAEDAWFLKMHYVDALARLITVRKLDVDNMSEEALDRARLIAIKEAQAATYRDANAVAEALSRFEAQMRRSKKRPARAAGVLMEGVMPFKKTPLNIAKQGVMFSPVGVMTATYKGLKKLKDSDSYTATDVIDDLAKGFTGTGIVLLGMFLASIGAATGGDDENKKKRNFDKMTGEQNYALKVGDKSYTIDWMAPLSLPFFVGVELYNLTQEEGLGFAQVAQAVSGIAEPLLELSVLQGINDLFETTQYSEVNPLFAVTEEMATSYVMQALPTVGGQVSRMVDGTKRDYYFVDKTKDIPRSLQTIWGQAAAKIPFASKLFIPSVDMWGREETYGGVFERAFENTVSPGYYAEENYNKVDKKLKELYERTGEASVFPTVQSEYYKSGGKMYYMDARLATEAKKMRGKKSFELVKSLLSDEIIFEKQEKRYSSMSDDEKVKAIKKCYDAAGEYTKEKMLEKVKK